MSSQLVSIGEVQNRGHLDEKIVLPQDFGLVSTQDELVKRHFHFLTQVTFLVFYKIAS